MTEQEFRDNVRGFLQDTKGQESLQELVNDMQEFLTAAKKYDPILGEHIEQVLSDMKRIESYVQTFYKLS